MMITDLLKPKKLRHHTCPYCSREVLSSVVNPYHLYNYCHRCGEFKRNRDLDRADNNEDDKILYLYLLFKN